VELARNLFIRKVLAEATDDLGFPPRKSRFGRIVAEMVGLGRYMAHEDDRNRRGMGG
jgi:hypothetical protein